MARCPAYQTRGAVALWRRISSRQPRAGTWLSEACCRASDVRSILDRMTARKLPTQVDFVYREAPGYNRHIANGVLAAPTGRGDFRLDFFFEYVPRPEATRAGVTDKGLLPETVIAPTQHKVVREVVTGVVMSLEQVRNMVAFLTEGLAKLDAPARPAK